jgi:mRNA interferase RelE/StbE
MYEVRISRPAQRSMDRLTIDVRSRLDSAIRALGTEARPPGSLKLSGANLWRIRVGDYRVVYDIRDQELIVLVVRVAHRREAYRESR